MLRERDLTIKGQEILTADKVAVRISIVVQFRVVDPKAALHGVENHEDYHQPTDTADRIDPGFFGDVADTIVDAVVTLDRAIP